MIMQDLSQIIAQAQSAFAEAQTPAALEDAKAKFLGKTGSITVLMKGLSKLTHEEKREMGQALGGAKRAIEQALEARREELANEKLAARLAAEALDVTLPGRKYPQGGVHPVIMTQMRIEEIFRSIGFDGILNYYDIPDGVLNLDIEQAFCAHTGWNPRLAAPYVVNADHGLVERIGHDMIKGITISAPGFYGPQGRYVRALPADTRLNEKIMSFDWHGERITNYEMESSMLAGMAHLLGHRAMTVCAIIAGRVSHSMNTNYKGSVEELIETVLERL